MVIYCEYDFLQEGTKSKCSVISEDFFQFVYNDKHILPNFCEIFWDEEVDVYQNFYWENDKISQIIEACQFFINNEKIINNYPYAKEDSIVSELYNLIEIAKRAQTMKSKLFAVAD